MKLKSKMNQSVTNQDGGIFNFAENEVFEFDYTKDGDHYFGWWYNCYLILSTENFEVATEKDEFLWKLRKYLEFITDNDLMDADRKTDQIYGFCQGCIFSHEEWFNEIAELNSEFHRKILFG